MLKTTLIYGLICCVVAAILLVAWVYFQRDKELNQKQKDEHKLN